MSPSATDRALPELADPIPLRPDLVADFRKHGHALVRQLATPQEVAAYRPHILATCERMKHETRPLAERDTYGKAFLQYWGLAPESPNVARFVLARRFARVAAELMGVSAVRLYHDQALLKEPGGGPTPFHQDQHYWPLDTSHAITMWMPLVPITADIGSMTFINGTHALGQLGEFDISDRSDAAVRALIAERQLAATTYGALAPGDATYHAGWTLHNAPANPTNRLREVMTIIYVAADARVTAPASHQQGDYDLWLKNLPPGALVDGPLHPIAWTAIAA